MTNSPKSTKKQHVKQPPRVAGTLMRRLIKLGIVAGIWGFLALAMLFAWYAKDLPDVRKLTENYKTPTVTVLANDGSVLTHIGNSYGKYIHIDKMPKNLVNAVLATEDRRFFSHFGIDLWGLLRASVTNLRHGHIVQGGSTITQQLAKIAFLTPERTFKRKIQEMMLALWLEYNFSKDEIFTIYMNRVYLGGGTYGIDAASQFYFNKPARKMNLYECAMIAGLLKAPSRYAPHINPDLAKNRTQQVLLNMVDADYITEEELKVTQAKSKIPNVAGASTLQTPYFADWIQEQLPNLIGDVNDDITIYTTFDKSIQKQAEAAVRGRMGPDAKKLKASQVSMVAMSPDGKILAMIGGLDYQTSQFNRATRALRQPGSLFKVFVYLAAMENGVNPDDMFTDEPITIGRWSPQNYDHQYLGELTAREAFAKSINTVAVRIGAQVGWKEVMNTALQLGISSPLQPNPSIALGSYEVTMLEMVQAFAHFASQGRQVHAYAISKIVNRKKKVLYKYEPPHEAYVIGQEALLKMNELMKAVVLQGTGGNANIGRPVAGKTGTTSDFRDAWFIGFTPQLVAGVWVGNDDNKSMAHVTGGSLPAKIWHDFMQQAVANQPALDIPSIGSSQQSPHDGEDAGHGNTKDGNFVDGIFNALGIY